MRNLENLGEISEIPEENEETEWSFSEEALEKYDKLFEMGDFWETEGKTELEDSEEETGLNEIEKNKDGLTEEEQEQLQEMTKWSEEVVDMINSWEEAEIYMKANLKEVEINDKKCLIREDINIDQEDEDGITNRERMERGRPPITKNGEEIELHHIGQKQNSPLAELTMEQHRGVGNDVILHDKTKETEIDRGEFAKERREHWKDRVETIE